MLLTFHCKICVCTTMGNFFLPLCCKCVPKVVRVKRHLCWTNDWFYLRPFRYHAATTGNSFTVTYMRLCPPSCVSQVVDALKLGR